MKSFSFIRDYANKYAYSILLSVFILWTCIGIFPLICYESDSLEFILGCDFAYSHGWKFPPVYSYMYKMQPLMFVLIVAMKHLLPFLTCEQIYCLTAAVSSFIFLIGCIEFARHITNEKRIKILIAAMVLPEMYAIAMYPNSAIPAAACFIWAMICLIKKRYWIAGLLMCMAPLFRAECIIVYPAILPLFLFEGKSLKKSLILSMIYGVLVVAVDLFFFWILKAEIFSSVDTYDEWNNRIRLTEHILAIFGFYSLSYVILLPIGIFAICKQRMWKELFLILLPILLLHFFFRSMGYASKHYLYIAPFVIIVGIRGISMICTVLSDKKILQWSAVACVAIFYILSVRLWLPERPYTKKDMRYNNGLITSVFIPISGTEISVGIGAGQYISTADEMMLASGQFFYSWHIHSCKSELKNYRINLKKTFDTLPYSNVISISWGIWSPILSEYFSDNKSVFYDKNKDCFTILDNNKFLTLWRIDNELVIEESGFQNCVKNFCKKLPQEERKYVLVSTFSFRHQLYLEKLAQQNNVEKITDGLYKINDRWLY